MLDIMYYYGNDATKELAIAMGKKEEGPSSVSTKPTGRHSSSISSNDSVYSPTGENVQFSVGWYQYFTSRIRCNKFKAVFGISRYLNKQNCTRKI